MDDLRIDRIARALGQPRNRRGALGLLAAATSLAAARPSAADAAKKPCPDGQTRCKVKRKKKRCVDLQSDPLHCGGCRDACKKDAVCSRGHCCPAGHEWVNGACFWVVNSDGDQNACIADNCNWFGSVVGSGNYLCGKTTGESCAGTETCPTGKACYDHDYCFRPCP